MTPVFYLFDLDGTLVDSAPDLAASANHLREVRDLPPVPFTELRSVASKGARGLLGAAFGITPEDEGYSELAEEFLDYYGEHLTDHLKFFPGVQDLLENIALVGKKWGIVTNKHSRFTTKVVEVLGMQPNVVVCGDTVPQRKPQPEPILYAVNYLGCTPEQGVYVGDDIRDIKAGKAAGCKTIAAAWGYLGCEETIENWGADAIAENPLEILRFPL